VLPGNRGDRACDFAPFFSHAADWPMHRGGPELRGMAQMAAPAKAELLWQFKGDKPVKGAAAIAGGCVFFGDDGGIVHALDVANGKEKWTFKNASRHRGHAARPRRHGFRRLQRCLSLRTRRRDRRAEMEVRNRRQNPRRRKSRKIARRQRRMDSRRQLRLESPLRRCRDGKAVWTHAHGQLHQRLARAHAPAARSSSAGCDSFIHVLQLADGKELRQIESDAYIASSVATADGLGYVGNYGNLVIAFDVKAAT